MKYLTLYWPAGGSYAEGRNEVKVANPEKAIALHLPTIEVENIGTHSFTVKGQTYTTNEYRSFIDGKPSMHVGCMGDAVILGLEEHFALSARGYRVRLKVAPR